MPEFAIYWEGTVSGMNFIEAETLEEAIEKAEDSDEPIDIEEYPTDWHVDKELTEMQNEESGEETDY